MPDDVKIEEDGDVKNSSLTYERKVHWQSVRWKNRRKMAWGSFCTLFIIVLLLFFAPIPDSRLTIIAEPIAMIAFGFVGVIGAYMGFTSMEKWKMSKGE